MAKIATNFRILVFASFLMWSIWSSLPYILVSFAHVLLSSEISWMAASTYSAGVALSCFVVATFMWWKSTWLRVVTAVFLAFGFAADFAVQSVNGFLPGPSGLNMAEIPEYTRLAVNEIRNVPDLVQDYIAWIGIGLAAMGVMGTAAWIAPVKHLKFGALQLLALPLSLIAAYVTLIQPHAVTRLQFIAPFNFMAMSAKVYLLESVQSAVTKAAPYFPPTAAPQIKKIVFIVDESVRGDYLTINNATIDSTPLLATFASKFLNYGVAVPVANCSTATRLALRSGIRARDLPDTVRKSLSLPTIWQYARQANLKTVHIDGFARRNVLYSFMSRFELSQIEERILPVERVSFTEIDNEAARLLNQYLDRPEPMFIYIDKVGVHFPHNGRHVPEDHAYEPQNMAQFNHGKQADHQSEIRHYLRSLRWRVDGFFEKIAHQFERDDVLFVYTSDHGQNMFEGETKVQHCNARFDGTGSARVPLLVATGNGQVKQAFLAALGSWKEMATQEPVFPTLLELMGYGRQDVNRVYGPSLFDQRPDGPRNYVLLDLFTGKIQSVD